MCCILCPSSSKVPLTTASLATHEESVESRKIQEIKVAAVALAVIAALFLAGGAGLMGFSMTRVAIEQGMGFLYSFIGTHMAGMGALIFVASVGISIYACYRARQQTI